MEAVVHWPDPSPLQSWWETVMRPARGASVDAERRELSCR